MDLEQKYPQLSEQCNTFKNRRDFNLFLSNIPTFLNDIKTKALEKPNLDFSDDEIKKISDYFIDLNNKQQFSVEDKKKFMAYLGEFLINNYGGEWFFTGGKDCFTPNEASISESDAVLLRECPIHAVYDIFERNNGNYYPQHLKENVEKKVEINNFFDKFSPRKKRKDKIK